MSASNSDISYSPPPSPRPDSSHSTQQNSPSGIIIDVQNYENEIGDGMEAELDDLSPFGDEDLEGSPQRDENEVRLDEHEVSLLEVTTTTTTTATALDVPVSMTTTMTRTSDTRTSEPQSPHDSTLSQLLTEFTLHSPGTDLTFTDVANFDPSNFSVRPRRFSYPLSAPKASKTRKSNHSKARRKVLKRKSQSQEPYKPANVWQRNPSIPIPQDQWEIEEVSRECKTLTALNDDEIECLVAFLSRKDFYQLGSVCRQFNETTSRDIYWRRTALITTGERSGFLSTYLSRYFESYKKRPHPHKSSWNVIETSDPDYLPLLPSDFPIKSHKDLVIRYKKRRIMTPILARMRRNVRSPQESRYMSSGWRWAIVGTFALTALLSLWVGSFLVPFTLDDHIPRSGYWWLFSYLASAMWLVPFVLYMLYDAKHIQKLPWISLRLFVYRPSPDLIQCVVTLFLWVIYVIGAMGIKLAALRSYAVWTYLMIPAVLIMIFNFVTVAMYVSLTISSAHNRSVIAISVGTGLSFLGFAASLLLSAAKLDNWLQLPYSVCFLGFHSGIIFLGASIAFFLYRVAFFEGITRNLWGLCLFPIIAVILAPSLLTIFLSGLRADNVIDTVGYTVMWIPLYTFLSVVVCCIGSCMVTYLCFYRFVRRFFN